MNSLSERSTPRKPEMAPPGQRDFMLSALRAASARARLAVNLFDTIGTALRHRMITEARAVEWLSDEGLIGEVEFRPELEARPIKTGGDA
jgi:hypothetical protein